MIQINKNIGALKHSATLVINQKVQELRSKNNEVYHFGFGQSPFPVHKSIVKALAHNARRNHYLPTRGLPKLKKSISKFLLKHQNIKIDSNSIFIGPGSKELLYQIIMLLDGIFLIPQASWVSYLPQIKTKGANFRIIPTLQTNNYKLEACQLEEACKSLLNIQKILILNSPNNPSGAVYTDEDLKAIAIICKKYDVVVLSDEIYSQINFKNSFSPSISNYYPKKTIIFGGLSKVFSAGGFRLGFVAIPNYLNEIYMPLTALISETFSCVSAPIQYAAIKAFNYKKRIRNYVFNCKVILNLIANYIYDELTAINVICTKPQGAFYMIIDFEKYRSKLLKYNIRNASQLTSFILDNYNVALLPGVDFYFPDNSLTCRLAIVDFDGRKVFKAYKDLNNIDINFIKKHTPLIFKGLNQIKNFLNSLS